MRNFHDLYHDHMEDEMENEDFPALENRILSASRKRRAACSAAPRKFLRAAVTCACVAAVAVGAMLLHGAPVNTSSAAQKGNVDNVFGLTVYANAAAATGQPAVLPSNAAEIRNADLTWGENITDFGHQRVIQDFLFDLNCQGSNIKSLKYEINGGGKFVLSEHTDDDKSSPYDELPKEKMITSFIAKPGDDLSRYRIHCEAPITAEEEAALKAEKDGTLYTPEEAKKLKARANAGDDMSDNLGPGYTIKDVKINDVLNGTTVSVEATFYDGTKQTVRYELSAVKDYLGAVRAHIKASREIENAYYDVHTKNGMSHSSSGISVEEYEKRMKELDEKTNYYFITKLK